MKSFVKAFAIATCLAAGLLPAQTVPEGVGQGYDGELKHVTEQLVSLAEATPADKFTWRPAKGVRSTSEVYMHIAFANFYLLSAMGEKMPADWKAGMGESVTAKADVIAWLKRSLDAVRAAHDAAKPADLQRQIMLFKRPTTVDAVFLRMIIHNNEHMGQLIGYARMSGVVPPWSK